MEIGIEEVLNGLDLFSGIGGLSLALSEWVKPIAYCESDRYCHAVLLQRMRKLQLRSAPIWDDIRTLRSTMLPRHGGIDIIYGGFPCQDISVAGAGAGLAGKRSGLVREIYRLVGELRPSFVFMENVPAIRTRGAGAVIGEMARLGYDARWDVISAQEIGAPHLRRRWFMLAADSKRFGVRIESGRITWTKRTEDSSESEHYGQKESMADACRDGWIEGRTRAKAWRRNPDAQSSGTSIFDPDWFIEPDVGRVAHGVPFRVDRLRGLGNAVVPSQAREAFQRLAGIA